MRKLILTLALVTGLGIVSPQEAAAKKVKVTSIEHCEVMTMSNMSSI